MKKLANDMYCKYPGCNRQDAYVYLDCEDEELATGYNPEIGNSISRGVYCGMTLRWACRPLTESSAELLLAEIEPLAEVVVAGYEFNVMNGAGTYDDEAQEAIDKIAEIVTRYSEDEDSVLKVWDAEEWFLNSKPEVDADTNIEDLEEQLVEEAINTGMCDRIHGVGRYLERLQYAARAAADERREAIETMAAECAEEAFGELTPVDAMIILDETFDVPAGDTEALDRVYGPITETEQTMFKKAWIVAWNGFVKEIESGLQRYTEFCTQLTTVMETRAPWQDMAQQRLEAKLGRKLTAAEFHVFLIAWMAPVKA
jgi:hypothetical protein